jgi:gliding motility-associated-like protein
MYWLTLYSSTDQGCKDTVSGKVYVAPMPHINLIGDYSACLGDTLTFAATSDLQGIWTWKLNNNPVFSGNPYNFIADNIGNYTLYFSQTTSNNCTTDSLINKNIVVHALPLVSFSHSIDLLTNSALVTLKDQSSGPVRNRTWIMPDGTTYSDSTINLILFDTLTLKVRLKITDTNNCMNEHSELLFFKLPNDYFIPNAFSPNGDGHNDVFKLTGYVQLKSFSMVIYNRWGEIVFKTDNPESGWDGKYQNTYVPIGEYMYTIMLEEPDGTVFERKGMLLIVR